MASTHKDGWEGVGCGGGTGTISWLLPDGQRARDVSGLRQALANGTLLLAPFAAEDYRPDVHGAAYRCLASSSLGAILSRRVQVRAVVKQFYELQVYDEFVVLGNTAVLRCHVPSFVRDYVAVTSWVRGARERITADVSTGGRYSVFASGELHIRHVTHADGALAYRCEARHRLTGETRLSTVSGRLLVTEPQSSVPPRVTDSRSHVSVRRRQPAELPCAAQGFPLPNYTNKAGAAVRAVSQRTASNAPAAIIWGNTRPAGVGSRAEHCTAGGRAAFVRGATAAGSTGTGGEASAGRGSKAGAGRGQGRPVLPALSSLPNNDGNPAPAAYLPAVYSG
ncbi:Down syndrome cell adhesion molecule-like protein Dscam2 [Schistocerca americana]|uniref:Down syndrome cell adhesion molecule-like protein Dscam2 n=1 Tax=Schistocerca americana TaxID=7009 RepID=UPI001F4FFD74|nr:Down syndrome cell adhesion molecule-like protein Dscam2 [Schistocerca americana]